MVCLAADHHHQQEFSISFRTEPVYRLVEREWKDFIEVFTTLLAHVDNQIPHLPPKDVIHRIYRDVCIDPNMLSHDLGLMTFRC
jgi:Conserved hypothetical protein (DUF2461)